MHAALLGVLALLAISLPAGAVSDVGPVAHDGGCYVNPYATDVRYSGTGTWELNVDGVNGTFYFDDRATGDPLGGDGLWIYEESNGAFTGGAPCSDLQVGGCMIVLGPPSCEDCAGLSQVPGDACSTTPDQLIY